MADSGGLATVPTGLRLVIALALFFLLASPLRDLAAAAGVADPGMVAFGGCGLLLVALTLVLPPDVPWRPLRPLPVLRAYVPFALGWVLLVVLYLRVAHWLGLAVQVQPQLLQLAEHGTAAPGFWLLVAGIVVVAPLAEEVLFRGYLLGTLLQAVPRWPAQLLTAAAFGLVHGLAYALPIAILGLLFGWLRVRYNALWPSVLAHAVHNGLTVTLALLWPAHLDLLYPR